MPNAKNYAQAPLVKLSEAQRLTGLTRYKLLGLAKCGHLRLKKIPTVNGRHSTFNYYLLREDLDRLVDVSVRAPVVEDRRRARIESRARGRRIKAALAEYDRTHGVTAAEG